MEGNRSLWRNLKFPEICPCNTFFEDGHDRPRRQRQMKKVSIDKVVGNFILLLLDIKFAPIGLRIPPVLPYY